MFKNLQETIKALNADVKNVANSEKAKKLRKKLLAIGLTMAIVGFVGVFVCFILFVTAGMGGSEFSARIIVPFVLFMPCGVLGGIGSMIASLGFSIVVTGYTANLVNETVGNNCPNCKETINSEMIYCAHCGERLKKECTNCKYVNDNKNEYCEKCGKLLY